MIANKTVLFEFEDGTIVERDATYGIKGFRHNGARPVYAIAFFDLDYYDYFKLKQVMHPVKGEIEYDSN